MSANSYVTISCPECGEGEFTVTDNASAPIPNPPTTIHDDEGQHISECPWCGVDLTPLTNLELAELV